LFSAFEASDPRDTIFALISLAKDTVVLNRWDLPPGWNEAPKLDFLDLLDLPVFAILHLLFWLVHIPAWFSAILHLLFWLVPKPMWHMYNLSDSRVATMQSDNRILPPKAGYDKSLMDVYGDFTEYSIEQSHSLEILCRPWAPMPKALNTLERCELGDQGIQNSETLPSWIPVRAHAHGVPAEDLTDQVNSESFVPNFLSQYQKHYNASAGLRPYVKFGKHNLPRPRMFDGTLRVKGLKLGVVEKLSGCMLNGAIPAEVFLYEPHSWRVLVAGRGPNGTTLPRWYSEAFIQCQKFVNKNGVLDTNKLLKDTEIPHHMRMFIERASAVTRNRNLFICSSGKGKWQKYCGLAEPCIQLGDVVCILFGCSVPVVLRPVIDTNQCKFVCGCYVQDMMDGEIFGVNRPKYPPKGSKEFVLV
jgi:hypothetical protein